MVRLEYSDQKSNKFWEAEVNGCDLDLRWGKIGTSGQSKTKNFASEELAQKELEKQKKSKLKKGYILAKEMALAATTSSPNPSPPLAKPEPTTKAKTKGKKPKAKSLESNNPWSKKAAQLLELEGPARPSLPKSEQAWIKAQKDWQDKPWKRGLGLTTPSLARDVRKAIDLMEQSEESHLLWAALFDTSSSFKAWAARGEAHKGLEALLELDNLRLLDQVDYTYLHRADHSEIYNTAIEHKELRVLKACLIHASEQEQGRARKLAEDAFDQAHVLTKTALSYLYSDKAQWAATAVQEILNFPGRLWSLPERCWLCVMGLEDGGLLESLCRKFPVAEIALLRLLQLDQLRNLDFIDELFKKEYDALPLYKTLTYVQTPEVANFLATRLNGKLKKKAERNTLVAYFEENPKLAFTHLPGKGAESDGLLKSLLRRDPEFCRELLPSLSGIAEKSLKSLLEGMGPELAEAKAEDVPPLLLSPPWSKKRSKFSIKSRELDYLPFESSVDWRDRRPPRPYYYDRPPKMSNPKIVDKAVKSVLESSGHTPLWRLDRLVDEAVLIILERCKDDYFDTSYSEVDVLISRLGAAGIPGLIKICSKRFASHAKDLSHLVAPEMAQLFARNWSKKTTQKWARIWFSKYSEAAAIGLIPMLFKKAKKESQAAQNVLHLVDSKVLKKTAKTYGVLSEIEELIDLDPMDRLPTKIPKLPPFAQAESLPGLALTDGKTRLPNEALNNFLTMLSFNDPNSPYPGIDVIRECCDQQTLSKFSWEIFEAWMRSGSPSKESWCLTSLGIFGNDETARKLTPMIRKWPGESAHARAVLGLDILCDIGTDIALMNLDNIARKLKFKGLQEKAREKIAELAERRGLTREELGDRLVPSLGLDRQGKRLFDFGPRQFELRLDETLQAQLYLDGKSLKNLPKPTKSDDADLAKQATADWKALKKDLKQVAKAQLFRLERAMTARRRWSAQDFQNFMLDNPLTFSLSQRLVWATYDSEGQLQSSFRVAEDRSLANVDEEDFTLPDDGVVGIPHPLDMPKNEIPRWVEVLADYELAQPFQQMQRTVHQFTDAELKLNKLVSAKGKKIPYTKLLALENRGWRRGIPEDGGVAFMEKELHTGEIAVLYTEPGLFMGALRESGEQSIEELSLRDDDYKTLKLSSLEPIMASELVYDLETL